MEDFEKIKENGITQIKELMDDVEKLKQRCDSALADLYATETMEDIFRWEKKYEDFDEGYKHIELFNQEDNL